MKKYDNKSVNKTVNQSKQLDCLHYRKSVPLTRKQAKNNGFTMLFNDASCQSREYKIMFTLFSLALIATISNAEMRIIIFFWSILFAFFLKTDCFNIFIRMSPRTKTFVSVSIVTISSSITLMEYITVRVAIILIVLSLIALLASYRLNGAWMIETEYHLEHEEEKLIKRQRRKIETLEKELQKTTITKNMQQDKLENLKIEIADLQDINRSLTNTNNELIENLQQEERKSQAFKSLSDKLTKQLDDLNCDNLETKVESDADKEPETEEPVKEEVKETINKRDAEILELLESGLSLRKTASVVGLSATMIMRIRDKYKESA